jgi:hypothetical protein
VRIILAEIRTGTRTIAGTDWPVEDQLHRTGEREWTITRDLCNGVPRSSEKYRSERAAREAFESRLVGAKPRAGEAGKPVTLRATAAERAGWQEAADRERLALSEWLRAAAELAIARGSVR